MQPYSLDSSHKLRILSTNNKINKNLSQTLRVQQLVSLSSQSYSKPKVINLKGNVKSSISQILASMTCCQHCQSQFRDILHIFADKLEKIRGQRNSIRDKYVEDVYQLNSKIKALQQEIAMLHQRLQQTDQKQDEEQQQNAFYHQYISNNTSAPKSISFQFENDTGYPLVSAFDSRKYDTQDIQIGDENLQKNNQDSLRNQERQNESKGFDEQVNNFSSIQKMAFKYNIGGQQLQNIIQQYLQQQMKINEGNCQRQLKNNKEIKRLINLNKKLVRQREMSQIKQNLNLFIKGNNKKTKNQ